ncbi:VOC family protein [Streptomyces fulvoviolaceus]|uniref:VOC family protein n=1 Tax=Streptomyces fulvoviolaceus TaxID=285535 RepID=UPI000A53AD0C|nr:VOC family protein [Streptomyces fulvoviolaceus]MCT9082607.1 VOC family protein [Streptomyces fulvoviolaceus]
MHPTLRPEDQFHVGIVAEDFHATKDQLSQLFGFEWGEEMGGPTEVSLPDGEAAIDFRCAYSRSKSTAPLLEIVRRVPGTLWEPTPGSGIHHFGYWSDDVASDTAELERHGYVTEATRKGPDGALFFAFLRSAEQTGFRIELVSRAAKPALEQAWSR